MNVKSPWYFYLILAALAVVSFIVAWLLPTAAFLKEMAAIPGVAGMLGILVLVVRDHSDFQRQVLLQTDRQDVELATASHMANTVFDKHAIFCEEYIAGMINALSKLFEEGPSTKAFTLAKDLGMIRVKHATWLTHDIEKQLIDLEQGIRQIGAKEIALVSMPVGNERTETVAEIYKKLHALMRDRSAAQKEEQEAAAITDVIDSLRKLLGVSELTAIRTKTIRSTTSRIG